MPKKILITGIEGYIGTNLKNFLNPQLYDVMGIDKKIGSDINHIMHFLYLGDFNIDCIIHLAAISSIGDCVSNPAECWVDNIKATQRVFKAAEMMKVPVIFASSMAAKNPATNIYAATKAFMEFEAFDLNQKGARIICLRIANVYGGEKYLEDKTSVVAKFIKAKLNGDSLELHGGGLQTRDFIHISDVCKAIELATRKEVGYNFGIDIGTGVETKIYELAKLIYPEAHYNETQNSPGVIRSCAKIDDAKEFLGFMAELDLKSGLKTLDIDL